MLSVWYSSVVELPHWQQYYTTHVVCLHWSTVRRNILFFIALHKTTMNKHKMFNVTYIRIRRDHTCQVISAYCTEYNTFGYVYRCMMSTLSAAYMVESDVLSSINLSPCHVWAESHLQRQVPHDQHRWSNILCVTELLVGNNSQEAENQILVDECKMTFIKEDDTVTMYCLERRQQHTPASLTYITRVCSFRSAFTAVRFFKHGPAEHYSDMFSSVILSCTTTHTCI